MGSLLKITRHDLTMDDRSHGIAEFCLWLVAFGNAEGIGDFIAIAVGFANIKDLIN